MQTRPILQAALLAWTLLIASACQTVATPRLTYEEATTAIQADEPVSVATLRTAFQNEPDVATRLHRLEVLERQVLAIIDDEPLKLGAIGSAILDLYWGSITGHLAMIRFYEHVDSQDALANHQEWLAKLTETINQHDGTDQDPHPVTTRVEAEVHMRLDALESVGGIYQSTEPTPFMLLLVGRHTGSDEDQALTRRYYDLSMTYNARRAQLETTEPPVEVTPFTLIGLLARESDSAAQTAVGAFLASRQRLDDAVTWLRAASRTSNVLANTLLARIHWDQARNSDDEAVKSARLEDVLDNYMHAIALGSGDAMYALAALYLGEQYGEENVEAGLPLLERAAKLEQSDAILYLGHLYAQGEQVPHDVEIAAGHYLRASSLGNQQAQFAYARFVLANSETVTADPMIVEWLRALADEENAEAMLLLGNLHARGAGVTASNSRALRWFKAAVEANPDDPNIVNEVAWTLTVSDVAGLPRPRYAKRIMDSVMDVDDNARSRPEYLDTWAAIHAANGDFETAIALQRQALERAREQERDDVVSILEEHLEKFETGQTILERAP